MSGFHLSYGAVMDLIAALNDVADENRTALRGRLEQLQRKKFPPGANTGRGKPASYTMPMILQLVVALELIQLGSTPERVVEQIANSIRSLARGFGDASLTLTADNDDVFYIYSARNLSFNNEDGSVQVRNVVEGVFLRISQFGKISQPGGFLSTKTRAGIINLSKLLRMVTAHINRDKLATSDQVVTDIQEWAGQYAVDHDRLRRLMKARQGD